MHVITATWTRNVVLFDIGGRNWMKATAELKDADGMEVKIRASDC